MIGRPGKLARGRHAAGCALYLRREHPVGPFWRRRWDVAAYEAPPDLGGFPRATWAAGAADAPKKGQRVVLVGCFNWRAIWLADQS